MDACTKWLKLDTYPFLVLGVLINRIPENRTVPLIYRTCINSTYPWSYGSRDAGILFLFFPLAIITYVHSSSQYFLFPPDLYRNHWYIPRRSSERPSFWQFEEGGDATGIGHNSVNYSCYQKSFGDRLRAGITIIVCTGHFFISQKLSDLGSLGPPFWQLLVSILQS